MLSVYNQYKSSLCTYITSGSYNDTHPPPSLHPEHFQGSRHNLALLLVVRNRDAFEGLEAVHGFLAAGQLVWEHTTHYTPQDLAGGTEMVWAMGGVGVHTLAQKLHVLHWNNKSYRSIHNPGNKCTANSIKEYELQYFNMAIINAHLRLVCRSQRII